MKGSPGLSATAKASRDTRSGEVAVSVRDLTFWYGSTLIVDDISFDMEQGQFLAIIGASGCGKSTLLQLLDGALRPNAGTVRIGGEELGTAKGSSRAMVYQSFALLPWKTVLQNVRLGLDYRRKDLNKRERTEIARRYVYRVGLANAENLYPYQLSGGMQQRVGLARAFAVQPELLLMDEPFAALDAQNAEILREEVRVLATEEHRSVVFVTHNLDEALTLADRVLLMSSDPGRIEEDILLAPLKEDSKTWSEHYSQYRAKLWSFLRQEVERAQSWSVNTT